MKTGETLQSDTNATILARLLALIQATNHPYVLIGDWQTAQAVSPARYCHPNFTLKCWRRITAFSQAM